MALPGTETMRFRRPTSGPNAVAPTASMEVKKDEFGSLAATGWKRRHQGLLQDRVGRQNNGPIVPSFSMAVRLLLLMRAAGAMYSIISDCDEVFNFFEPLHYFQYNSGFQTWELSPQFAVRSWAYILLHWPLAHLGPKLLGLGKRQAFFALRMSLGAVSSLCEAFFFRAVVEAVNERVGRYLLFSLLLSAGMWTASTAFLPSTFTMYTTMLACAWSFYPATSTPTGKSRALKATLSFALGAIVGWPFVAVLAVPFVLEQLFLTGGQVAVGEARAALSKTRLSTMVRNVAVAASIAIPVYLVDSWAYGRRTFPTLNIVLYNLFSGNGPALYGTSPSTYYFANLFLNFNYLLPLSLLALPALAITYQFDNRRLGKTQQAPVAGETSPYTLLSLRLLPFYLWLAIMSLQPHKEERFMFPVYPLLCFNACVTVFLVKGWMETTFIYFTNSPYRAGRTSVFSNFTLFAILVPGVISVLRIIALYKFYHAPLDVAHHFEYKSIPSILSSLGHAPIPPPKSFKPRPGEKVPQEWDYSPLARMDNKVTLCYGTEWHRFPGSYLVPEGVEVRWIKTDFDGMMPRRWEPSPTAQGGWPREETRTIRAGRFNGENKASSEPGTYTDVANCNYLVSLTMPSLPKTAVEMDHAADSEQWEREFCTTFLDAQSSEWWSKLIWLPGGALAKGQVYGEYCLLRKKGWAPSA